VSYDFFFDLNNGCNLHCTMCGGRAAPSKQSELPLRNFKEQVVDLCLGAREFQIGCQCEPTIVSYLPTAIELLQEHNATNGSIVSNFVRVSPDLVNQLGTSGVIRRAWASFDGATKATFESIRRGAIYEKVLANVTALAQHPILVYLIVTLQEANLHELLDLVKLANKLKLGLRLHRLAPQHTGCLPRDMARRYNGVVDRARELAAELNVKFLGQSYASEDDPPVALPTPPSVHQVQLVPSGDVKVDGKVVTNLFYPTWKANLAHLIGT